MFLNNKTCVFNDSAHNVRKKIFRVPNKNSVYLEQLKPIIVALKIFGLMPITHFESGKRSIIIN